jgi:serine/threonine-protein kinase
MPNTHEPSDIFAISEESLALLAPVLAVGSILHDNFRLDKRLTTDALGENWMATDRKANENVIIYLPPSEIRKNKSTAKTVRRAAKHVEALKHPHIVPIVGHFTDAQHGFFVVRKFLHGNALDMYWKKHVKQHKNMRRIITILSATAAALDYAHNVNIVKGSGRKH